jgi:hypothetical protein
MAGESWVIYRMTLYKEPETPMAVCGQAEWDAMERANPGRHALVRDGIATETEAELLARGTSGDAVPRGGRRRRVSPEEIAGPGPRPPDRPL